MGSPRGGRGCTRSASSQKVSKPEPTGDLMGLGSRVLRPEAQEGLHDLSVRGVFLYPLALSGRPWSTVDCRLASFQFFGAARGVGRFLRPEGLGETELGSLLFRFRLRARERIPSSPVGMGRRWLWISPREVGDFRGLPRLSLWRPGFWIPSFYSPLVSPERFPFPLRAHTFTRTKF